MSEQCTSPWEKLKRGFQKIRAKIPKPTKKLFWVWVAYQTIKGSLTFSLIWFPLFWAWMHFGDTPDDQNKEQITQPPAAEQQWDQPQPLPEDPQPLDP